MKVKIDGYGKDKESIDYWLNNRKKLSDLYRSEAHFFQNVIMSCTSVLDIGCAAGGSALFTREAKIDINYVGIDVSKELVQAATNNFSKMPKTIFMYYDGKNIPLQSNSIDFVFSFGVFHHLDHWRDILSEALRVSSKYVLFDLRLWSQESMVGDMRSYQKLALGGSWDGESILPYNIISFNEFGLLARDMNQLKISCKAFGYYQKPTSLAVTPAKEILMLSILLEKDVDYPTFEFVTSEC